MNFLISLIEFFMVFIFLGGPCIILILIFDYISEMVDNLIRRRRIMKSNKRYEEYIQQQGRERIKRIQYEADKKQYPLFYWRENESI